MKTFLVTFGVMAYVCFVVGMFCSDGGFNTGYYKGTQHTKLYYEATQTFPIKAWLDMNKHNEFRYIEEILETLKPYGGEE